MASVAGGRPEPDVEGASEQIGSGEAAGTQTVAAAREKGPLASLFTGASGVPTWLNFWVPLTASILSLILAVFSLLASTQDPEVLLILPNQLYMSEADPGGSEYHPDAVYLQPNFVSTGNNDRTEMIRGMTLTIDGDGSPQVSMEWREQGIWDFSEGFQVMLRVYRYTADAAPMLVSPNQAQQPLSVFVVPTEWTLQPDTPYRVTLTADRAVAGTPLVATAEMRVPAGLIDGIKTQTQQTILTIPIVPNVQP